jgi:hypothetical protein
MGSTHRARILTLDWQGWVLIAVVLGLILLVPAGLGR